MKLVESRSRQVNSGLAGGSKLGRPLTLVRPSASSAVVGIKSKRPSGSTICKPPSAELRLLGDDDSGVERLEGEDGPRGCWGGWEGWLVQTCLLLGRQSIHACHEKFGPPKNGPPGPYISKCLDPPELIFQRKCWNICTPSEIFVPPGPYVSRRFFLSFDKAGG